MGLNNCVNIISKGRFLVFYQRKFEFNIFFVHPICHSFFEIGHLEINNL
jgi:hypothetical protein